MFGKLRTEADPKPSLINKTRIGHLLRRAEQLDPQGYP
jgi:hypothetical protein